MASGNPEKKPSAIKQLWQAYQVTRKTDHALTWIMLALLLAGAALGVLAGLLLGGNWLALSASIVIGVLIGLLGALNVLGRRAQNAILKRMVGQPGAVGAVLSSLTGSWHGSQMPVAVNSRTADALYRAVGPKGVVLVVEGNASKAQRMVFEERAKVHRVVPNVAVNVLHCAEQGKNAVPLSALAKSVKKVHSDKPRLSRAQVQAVQNRLSTLDNPIAMPKGIDPLRMRPDHRAIRGR